MSEGRSAFRMNQPGMARVRPSKLFHQMRAGLSFAWLEAGVAQPRSIPAMSQDRCCKVVVISFLRLLLLVLAGAVASAEKEMDIFR